MRLNSSYILKSARHHFLFCTTKYSIRHTQNIYSFLCFSCFVFFFVSVCVWCYFKDLPVSIAVREWVRLEEWEKERSWICWFILQDSSTAGPSWNQEPGIFHMVAVAQTLGSTFSTFPRPLAGSWVVSGVARTPIDSHMRCQCVRSQFNTF